VPPLVRHDGCVTVLRIDHVQLAMPADGEAAAAAFYEGLLGLRRVPKPEQLSARGGCWFEAGAVKVHLGVEADFVPARKAHPAFVVDDLRAVASTIAAAGHDVALGEPIDGYDRVHVHDPFGNRIELMQMVAASS
jgi:catechol 2,3-dioxygenase-like lactoylglutathione lyase family enzyme